MKRSELRGRIDNAIDDVEEGVGGILADVDEGASMTYCPICNLKNGESFVLSPFAPSLMSLKTTRMDNGMIEMKCVYGDDFDRLLYMPSYCPECGRKIRPQKEE